MLTLADPNALPLDELLDALVDRDRLDTLIAAARDEDLGDRGDITSDALIDPQRRTEAAFRVRRPGVLSGGALLTRIAAAYDTQLEVELRIADGAHVQRGSVVAAVTGTLRSLLAAERVMLNFLTHMSGIATATALHCEAVLGTGARIYDTRKTVPGLRGLAKYAVRCGGGYCHRIGLFDAVLIKDNHIAHLGDDELKPALDTAIASARSLHPRPAFVEIEVDTLEQLRTVLACDIDIVLLDNLPADELRQAVAIRDELHPSVQLEASGGVTMETVRALAETGVGRIAIGAITHSAPSLDIGLDIDA